MEMYFILLVKTRNLSRNGSSQGIKKEEATMRDKSVETLPYNGPFLHSGHTYPLPLPLSTPTPSPQNQCCILDP